MTAGPQHSRWLPRIVVLATGMALGFFLWRIYFEPIPRLYPAEFKQGHWLVAPGGGPQGYFRKEFYIAEAIQRAWVVVAATDAFMLYVNGKAVDAKAYASLNVSGIYDIGHYLHPGKNVLGVATRRISYPGAAMAVLEGAYADYKGHEYPVAMDASWKCAPTEERQGGGEIPWYSELFDDTSWLPAKQAGHPQASEVYPLRVPPLAFTMPPRGQWIGHAGPPPYPATFSSTLTLLTRVEAAWIRVTAAKPYSLVVNGVTVEGEDDRSDLRAMNLIRLQGGPIWNSQNNITTDLYDLAALLRPGGNRITVSIGRWSPSFPGLLVDGFLLSHGEVLTFGSDATWAGTPPFHSASDQRPAPSTPTMLIDRDISQGPLPIKKAMKIVLPLRYTAQQAGRAVLVMALMAVLTFTLWQGTSRLMCALLEGDPAEVSNSDALAHLPTLLGLLSLILLSFDVRIDPAFPFQDWVIWLAAAALLILKATLILEGWYRRKRRRRHRPHPPPRETLPIIRYGHTVLLICLLAIGAFLRLHNLDAQSLYHDEVHMVTFVQGLLEKGYPFKMIGPIERPLATYELVPYPIALSAIVIGLNDFALRLPAALFGIMTIPLIYLVGKHVFDLRVGLLAAVLYTFCPQALVWAKYLWHPQQTQFFALLTSYLFYQAIRSVPITPKYIYLAALSFLLAYLSWEGTGFFLLALYFGLLAVKGKDWIRCHGKHFWLAIASVGVAVTFQLVRRLLLQVPYLVVGQGLSDVSLPTFYFLNPMYDPTFYIKNFLWLENNVILVLLLLGALPFLFKVNGFSYYCVLLFSVIFMMTNFLPNASNRYVYYLEPFLILPASFVIIFIVDYIMGSIKSRQVLTVGLIKWTTSVAIIMLVTVCCSPFMKLFRLTNFSNPYGVNIRPDTYYIDYRTSSQYLQSHYNQGDLVISVIPEALRYYSGITSHYFIENYAMRQLLYDPTESLPRYLERMVGTPLIRSLDELQHILADYRRVWIVAVPYGLFSLLSGHEVTEYVRKEGKAVYESYNARVYLLQN